MEWAALIIAGLVLVGGVVVFAVPRRVEYTEEIVIDAPASRLYDVTRFQEHLMRWSAWPSETGSTCACEDADGEVGARTVFFSKGKRFGYQEITALEPNRSVTFKLRSAGPPHWPVLTLEFVPLSPERTRVLLHFRNDIMRPFNVILRVAGIVRWTREMHRKDLAGLKRYAEPPHRTYTNEPAPALGQAA